MKVYEAFVRLGSRFEDRRIMFQSLKAGNRSDYDDYIALEDNLLDIVLEALRLTCANELDIFYREFFDTNSELFSLFTEDGLVTPEVTRKTKFSDKADIKEVLRFLCRDLGFITLGQKRKILIIPTERLGFFLCLPSSLSLITPGVFEIDTSPIEESMHIYGVNEVALP